MPFSGSARRENCSSVYLAQSRHDDGTRRCQPAVRREAVAQVRVAFEVSERRACSVLGVDRTSVRYRNRRPDDAPLRVRLRELAGQRRRFGYRRLHILMIWEGLHMNHKKLRRLYREEDCRCAGVAAASGP